MKALSENFIVAAIGRATITDVASRSGVSIATVSRVVNNPGAVRPDTEERVRRAMEELEYVPNGAGRSLAGGRAGNIGVLLLTPGDAAREDAFFLEMLRGLETAVEHAEVGIVISMRAASESADAPLPRPITRGRVDGLVVIGGPQPARYEEEIGRLGVPVVALSPDARGPAIWSVTADSRRGSEQAVTHLIGLGRRRIAHVGGPTANRTSARKLEGYQLALARHGITPDPALHVVEPALHTREGGRVAVERLLADGVVFDALYASDDLVALGALAALQAHGRAVPSDVALVGYGDLEVARASDPALSTVHVNFRHQGWLAGNILLAAVQGRAPTPIQVNLETRLVVRATSMGAA